MYHKTVNAPLILYLGGHIQSWRERKANENERKGNMLHFAAAVLGSVDVWMEVIKVETFVSLIY